MQKLFTLSTRVRRGFAREAMALITAHPPVRPLSDANCPLAPDHRRCRWAASGTGGVFSVTLS